MFTTKNNDSNEKSMWEQPKSTSLLMRSVSLFVASSRRVSTSPATLFKTISTGNENFRELNENMIESDAKCKSGRKKSSDGIVDTLKKQTHFSRAEIEKLCNLFKKLTSTNELSCGIQTFSYATRPKVIASKGMDRIMFRELLHNTFHILTEDVIMDRIFNAFDRRSDGIIHMDEWILGLSIFLRGTLEEQISFTFFVYDLNSDGVITKEEIFTLLRNSLLKLPQDEDPDESVKDLTDITLKKIDCDKDGKISFQDFRRTVTKDNLLLEALGQCLPTEEVCKTFLSSLMNGKP